MLQKNGIFQASFFGEPTSNLRTLVRCKLIWQPTKTWWVCLVIHWVCPEERVSSWSILGQLSGNFDTTVEIHWVCPDRRVSSWSILGGVIKLRGVCFGLWDPLESPPSISILGGGELYHSHHHHHHHHHHHQYHCVLDYLPHHLHVLVCETCWRAPNSSQSWVGTRSIQLHRHLILLLWPYHLILQ